MGRISGILRGACIFLMASLGIVRSDQPTGRATDTHKPFPVVETGGRVIKTPTGVHPFYQKYINADGIIIVSSARVPDAALLSAHQTVLFVISKRPDVHKAMLRHHPRISIMSISEKASDLPEYGPWADGQWGLGQRPQDPTALVSEKGICYEGNDHYIANFLLHEFVHMIHNLAIRTEYPEVALKIFHAYAAAVKRGTFIPPKEELSAGLSPSRGYGVDEYFTHSINAWYDLNEALPGIWMDYKVGEWGPRSGTRKELLARDPDICEIILHFFPETGGGVIEPCRSSRILRPGAIGENRSLQGIGLLSLISERAQLPNCAVAPT